jgi:thiosulfate/3-mercaptopyruvate sulfurtransferase
MPNDPRDCKAEHLEARITPDTQFFDHDKVVAEGSDLPHTMPPLHIFQAQMDEFNIHPHHNIVCYDNQGMFSVARCAWMLRYYGA